MKLLSFFIFLLLSVPAFSIVDVQSFSNANKSDFDILRELSDGSLTSKEKIKPIQSLQKTDDVIIHQKLIEITLFDEDVNVRMSAEKVLQNILDLDAQQKQVLVEFLEPATVFAYKRIRLRNNLSPFTYFYIYFFLINDPVNTEINKHIFSTIKEITESHQVFQNIMLKLLTLDVEDIQKKAEFVLLNADLSLETQRQLLKIIFSKVSRLDSQLKAQNILKHKVLHLEIQKELVKMVQNTTSQSFSRIFTKTDAEYILTGVPAMDPVMQTNLVKIATSEYSTDFARKTASNILMNAYASLEIAYSELIQLAITNNESSEVKKNAKNILLQLSPIKENLQEELWRISNSDSATLEARRQARKILINTKYIYPRVERDMSILFRCRRAFAF